MRENEIRILPIAGIPEIRPSDDIGEIIAGCMRKRNLEVFEGDVLVIAQKIVSKAEGRIVPLDSISPSPRAVAWAAEHRKDARAVELVLREARRVVRMERGTLIVETRHGFVCANGGVDVSNTTPGTAVLLPEDPDKSAEQLRAHFAKTFGISPGVIVSDTFGRPWRNGLVNVAIGVAGIAPLIDYRGQCDAQGRVLQSTVIAVADELASAAELVMGKAKGTPAAVVRGLEFQGRAGTARDLLRAASEDLFR